MGRRQSHPPGDREVGVGVGAPSLGREWGQQGCWRGPSSAGRAGHVPSPEALLGPKPACPSACPASSSSTDTDRLTASCHADPHHQPGTQNSPTPG